MFKGLEHTAIASPHPEKLAQWYVDHLEFRINYTYAGNYFVRAENHSLIEIIPSEGERAAQKMKDPGIRHMAIVVDDFDAGLANLKAKNVEFLGRAVHHAGQPAGVFFRWRWQYPAPDRARKAPSVESVLKRVFKAFQYRDFSLLWAGACTSSIGTWMQIVAQSWLVLEISKSPFFLGLRHVSGSDSDFVFLPDWRSGGGPDGPPAPACSARNTRR